MTTTRTALNTCAAAVLALAALSAGATAQKAATGEGSSDAARFPERIWRDPGDAASLDLTYGAGGKAQAPDVSGPFTFVAEDTHATSPKFDVTDGRGVEWRVKLGEESRSETAATRFLWAAGYFTDEDYYLTELTVTGLPTLRRGQEFVSSGGVIRGARLERRPGTVTKVGDWGWFDNPFLGQRELNGLRVMMSLLNNWDLKQVNNAIYEVDGERHYAVSDIGAAFGKTGNVGIQTKGVPRDYASSQFVAKVRPDEVDFVLHSRPMFLLWVFAPAHYRERTRMEQITRQIPLADARWLGQRLSRLSDRQIRDGFRAAGYLDADVETLARTIRQRIAALEAL